MSGGSSPIRILAVDDHPLVREGIAGLVGVQPDDVGRTSGQRSRRDPAIPEAQPGRDADRPSSSCNEALPQTVEHGCVSRSPRAV